MNSTKSKLNTEEEVKSSIKQGYTEAISNIEKIELMALGRQSLTKDGTTLNIIKSKVNLSDFLNYINSKTATDFDSIRMYPGFILPNKLHTILCRTRYPEIGTPVQHDFDFRLLDQTDYTGPAPFPKEELDRVKTQNLILKYFSEVKVEGSFQTTNNLKYIKSRIYKWLEIKTFLAHNIEGFDPLKPDDYKLYSLHFEIGFIDDVHSGYFLVKMDRLGRKPVWANSPSAFSGITFIVTLVGSDGQEIISDNVYPGKEYKEKAMEVAHPCPPLCGDMLPQP